MADLTFQQLADQLPANSIIEDGANNDVTISLKTLMGETAVSLSDEKVSEFLSKTLSGASAAQVAYNGTDPAPATPLNGFPNPTRANPVTLGDGSIISVKTHTVRVAVPLQESEIRGAI